MKILTFLFLTVFTLNFAQTKSSTKDNLKEKVENELKSGDAKFIAFGFAMPNSDAFKKKYGVGLKSNGCVVSKPSSDIAKENNMIIAVYLTKKYGYTWIEDLPYVPFGLDEI